MLNRGASRPSLRSLHYSGAIAAFTAATAVLVVIFIATSFDRTWIYVMAGLATVGSTVAAVQLFRSSRTQQLPKDAPKSPPLASYGAEIADTTALYDAFRNALAVSVFNILWNRNDPRAPMKPSELCGKIRPLLSSAGIALTQVDLERRVRELALVGWLPTLVYQDQGYSLSGDTYSLNAQMSQPQKDEIAGAAICLLPPTTRSIALDSGSTTLIVARALAERPEILASNIDLYISSTSAHEVMLSSPSAVQAARSGLLRVHMAGGVAHLDGGSIDSHGKDLPATIDIAFVGANGVTAEGFFAPSTRYCDYKKSLIGIAEQAYIVADSSKLGRELPSRFAQWEKNIKLIVDKPSERRKLAELAFLPSESVILAADILGRNQHA